MTLKRFSLTVGFSLIAVTASAQEKLTSNEKFASTVWASAVTADYITTYKLLDVGGRERAPHLAWLQHKPIAMTALGVSVDAGSYWLFKHAFIDNKENAKARWFFKVALYSAAGFRTYLAVKNYKHYKEVKNYEK